MIWYPEALSTEWSNLAAHGLHQRAGRFFMGIPTHKIQNPKNPGFPHGSNRMFWLPIPSEKNRIVGKNKPTKKTPINSFPCWTNSDQITQRAWALVDSPRLIKTTLPETNQTNLPKSSQAEHQHKTKTKTSQVYPSISHSDSSSNEIKNSSQHAGVCQTSAPKILPLSWMSQEVSKWLVNELQPNYKCRILGL